MPSHLSTIGINIGRTKEAASILERAAEDAKEHACPNGAYLEWRSDTGAQLWFQMNRRSEAVGLNPHFSGPSRLPIIIESRIERGKFNYFDGAFGAWVNDKPGEPLEAEGYYPLIFDCPDFRLYPEFSLPAVAEVQIAAFAHQLSFFDSEEAFQEQQTKIAAEAFVPVGLFNADDSDKSPPRAEAFFNGRLLAVEKRINELAEGEFYWLSVRTFGGTYDVVADPEFIPEEPTVGGIVSGSYWLSGRLTDYPSN